MFKAASLTAIGTSVVVHGGLLFALALIQMNLLQLQPEVLLETVFDDERVQEEFTRELESDTEIAETQNFMAGGAIATTAIGGTAAPAVAQQQIDQSETLKEPEVQINAGEITIPGENLLGQDLGPAEVSGEIGAVVEGYGAALGRITQELIRLMRRQRVMVVWLFDQSESMRDDQQEIKQKFHKVYEELGIQQRKDKELHEAKEILLTAILGFGRTIQPVMPKPTADINQIRAAIDRIKVDESGDENMCYAVLAVVDKYGSMARSQKRKLVIVVVSDESPTDDKIAANPPTTEFLEPTIEKCKKAGAPVYVLGREAIFGYPFARIAWKDPVYGLHFNIWIDRGPETAFPECLQYNGIGRRWDNYSSGFGPYSQVRLAKETGGIFFLLPSETEEQLVGAGTHEKRKFEFLAMKEYRPLLMSRRNYIESRRVSKFRSTLWDIIVRLNPHRDDKLSIRFSHFPVIPAEFRKQGLPQFQRAAYAMGLLNQAVALLEKIEPLRDEEQSQRWRAHYDLILAQCLSFRVRLFQYMLVMDRHAANIPKPKEPKHNEWNFRRTGKTQMPDDAQFNRIKNHFNIKVSKDEYLAELKRQEKRATEQFLFVEKRHPGTPWAQRARFERGMGFGIQIRSQYRNPRYAQVQQLRREKKIQIPKF